jgi:hypothetical protein
VAIVNADAAQAWFIAGALVFMVAGGLHVVLTLVDTVRPRYFAPKDRAIKPAVEGTSIRFGGTRAPSMWSAWLGFNISHGLGVFTVGLLCLLIATHDFDLVERIDAIRPVMIAFSAVYLAVSLRFWFWGATLVTGTATVCFTVAALLSA